MKVYGNLDLKSNSIINCANLQPAQIAVQMDAPDEGVALWISPAAITIETDPLTGEEKEVTHVAALKYMHPETKTFQTISSLAGASAFDLWVSLPENAGKTQDDFFQSLKGQSCIIREVDDGIKITALDENNNVVTFLINDGKTPSIDTENIEGGVKITTTDGNGNTKETTIQNGKNPSIDAEKEDGVTTITLTDIDNNTKTVKINDGAKGDTGVGIRSVDKTGTTGKVDTYTITYTDDTISTFNITNGSGDEITKLSQLENDSEFITSIADNLLNYYTKDNTYTKTEVEELIGRMNGGLSFKITENLNTEIALGVSSSTIYLVETAEGSSVYTQYIWMTSTNSWAMIGTTEVDLSNYYNKSDIDNKLSLYASITFVMTLLTSYTPTTRLSKVALSNNYNDLDNLPTIPSIDGLATTAYVDNAIENVTIYDSNYRKKDENVPYSEVSGTPNLKTVATSGSYNDLDDKPTIPSTANDLKAVSYESQTLSVSQKQQARNNIGAGTSDLAINDTTASGSAVYSSSKVNSLLSNKENSLTVKVNVNMNNRSVVPDTRLTFQEYFRYSQYGKLVIVDLGGLKATMVGTYSNFANGFPVQRSRFVVNTVANGVSTGKTLWHGNINTGTFSIYIDQPNIANYGQAIYLTD